MQRAPAAQAAPIAPATFRQLVEQRLGSLGILFHPQMNRFQEAKQIYTLGEFSVYFDGAALFMWDAIKRAWTPMALEALIHMCQQ